MEKNTKVILVFFVAIVILVAIMYFSVSKIGNKKEKEVVEVEKGFFSALGSGEIEIIEFSDFQCPICGQQESILKNILETYGNKVRLFYKNFPLPMHENSFNAALASLCSNEQGKFWEYHDLLFENQQALDKKSLKNYAEQLNLNTEQFNSCLDSEKYKKDVEKDFNEGKNAGVTGTPTFFINGKKYEGFQSFENFKRIIEK